MSVESLIDQYGVTMTVKRPTLTADSTGNPTHSTTYATTSVTGFLQVLTGGTGRRWGAERERYDATCYFKDGTDVKGGDLISATLDSLTRSYRVESVRTADERPSGDPLRFMTVGLQEDLPRT